MSDCKVKMLYLVVLFGLLTIGYAWLCDSCEGRETTADTVVVVRTDTLYRVKVDTVPEIRKELVLRYKEVPVIVHDSIRDTLDVVQREYSDDSTYTAYVSGLRYEDLPKLDSIAVRQREVTRTVREVITVTGTERPPRISFGLQGGFGYGLRSNMVEPYIGIGISYRLW